MAGDSNTIKDNKIGTDLSGTLDVGNGRDGIYIFGYAEFNTIEQNLISGNVRDGIRVKRSLNTEIIGNLIGTDLTGTVAIPNGLCGVNIVENSDHTVVGGDDSSSRNIISGNAAYGVMISNSDSCSIKNNYIGTDINGASALGNGTGVLIISPYDTTECRFNTVEKNLISGSTIGDGVSIEGENADSNVVIGNFIGTDASGTYAIGKAWSGVELDLYTEFNRGGGAAETDPNVISGNGHYGIRIAYSNFNSIYGNYIGTDTSEISIVPNGQGGILVEQGAQHNMIGGTLQGEANIITFNGRSGIELMEGSTDNNTLSGNSIYGNDALGIDLWPEGVTENDSGDTDTGPNENLNFPVIDSASTLMVWATAPGYSTVEIFLSDGDPSGYGEGKTFLASATAHSSGHFAIAIPGVPLGELITATATDQEGNTSEFSQNCQVEEVGVSERTNPETLTPRFSVVSANPFNKTVKFSWRARSGALLSLRIYDVAGNLVRVLINERTGKGSKQSAIWNGRDECG